MKLSKKLSVNLFASILLLSSCTHYAPEGRTYQRISTYREVGVKCPSESYYSYSEGHCTRYTTSSVEGPGGLGTTIDRLYKKSPDIEFKLSNRHSESLKGKRHTNAKAVDCKAILSQINRCSI